MLSVTRGREALTAYLRQADALPLRGYVPLVADTLVELRLDDPVARTVAVAQRIDAAAG